MSPDLARHVAAAFAFDPIEQLLMRRPLREVLAALAGDERTTERPPPIDEADVEH